MNKHLFLVVGIPLYVAILITTFDILEYSILIFTVGLLCLGSWLYGIRRGYALMVCIILINTVSLIFASGKFYDIIHAVNPIGLILSIIGILVIGSMRETQDEMNELKGSLTARVDEATYKLNELAQQLIENDEADRIRIGQDLHDGAGQYLTGMLLYSEALIHRLTKDHVEEAEQAAHIPELVQKNIFLIRDFARSLLPDYLDEAGFNPAMEALVDFFRDAHPTEFNLVIQNTDRPLPQETSLHLYRITQEAIFCLLKKSPTRQVDIGILMEGHDITLSITGYGCTSYSIGEQVFESKSLKYRSRAINGTLVFENPASGIYRMECSAVAKGDA